MDIHTWCTIPEAELAKKCFFYMDDVSLEVIEEPPLAISTPLDEYYCRRDHPVDRQQQLHPAAKSRLRF